MQASTLFEAMNWPWRHSLTGRTLLLLAVAVGVTIIAATGVTYRLVFRAIEEHSLLHLNEYIAERTQQEEREIVVVVQNLETARKAFLKRYHEPDPRGFMERWDFYFERTAEGAWVSKRQYSNDYEWASLWGHRDLKPSDDAKRRILIMFEVSMNFLPGWVHDFRSFYGFTSDEMMIVGFNPDLPDWVYHQAPDYNMNAEEWGHIAMPEHNPSRGMVWSGATADPTAGESLVQVLLPVDLDGRHLMTLGHDMHVNHLVAQSARGNVEGLVHMIVHTDGRLIAHPHFKDAIYERNGAFRMQDSGDATLASLHAQVARHSEEQFSGFDEASGHYFVGRRLDGPGWIYLTTMPLSVLRGQAFESTRWVLWSALASLALELALLGVILRRSIARPITRLVKATRRLAAGKPDMPLDLDREDELGELAAAFTDMAAKVRERDTALREEKAGLEKRVAERTTELQEALAQQIELARLKSDFVSLVSHEFRTPLGVIMSAADVLQRYFGRLPRERRERHLDMILRSTRNLASLIEEVLLLGKVEEGRMQFVPASLDLERFCRGIADELRSATNAACPIRFSAPSSLDGAVGDEGLLRHILGNLLSNAVKYSAPGTPVDFTAERKDTDVVFIIRDQGIGIPPEDQARLFTSFTRGSNVGARPGTGLGLVVVQRCVTLHGGTLHLQSAPGVGTTVTVTLRVFHPDTRFTTHSSSP